MKAVIFDHDGTLVDSEGCHHQIWHQLLSPWNIDFPLQEYIALHAGVPTARNAEILFNTYDIPLANHQALFQLKEIATKEYLSKNAFPLLPHVKETLAACQSLELTIGLATGASQIEANTTLQRHHLAGFFSTVATRELVENSKPAPDVYLLAASKLDCAPQECIAIEDSESGLMAAKSAGMICITIPNAFSLTHDLSAADYLVADLQEALSVIKTLCAQ